MDNENELNELNELNPPVMDGYTKIPTFKLWVANNFPYMETDFDGLTNYDLMGALTDYLNNVIKNEENVESNVAKLNQAYLELFNYVKDYFNNLDVQEEINNKLDDLVADGTLTRLIGEYVQPLIDEQNQKIAEFKTSVNSQIVSQNAQIQAVTSGSPLVASSVAQMTDTTRVYVNTTDGNWYYYNGSAWTIGGVYQSTGIADYSIGLPQLKNEVINDRYENVSGNKLNPFTCLDNKGITSANGSIVDNANYWLSHKIYLNTGDTLRFYNNVNGHFNEKAMYRLCAYQLNDTFIESLNNGYFYTATQDCYVLIALAKTDITFENRFNCGIRIFTEEKPRINGMRLPFQIYTSSKKENINLNVDNKDLNDELFYQLSLNDKLNNVEIGSLNRNNGSLVGGTNTRLRTINPLKISKGSKIVSLNDDVFFGLIFYKNDNGYVTFLNSVVGITEYDFEEDCYCGIFFGYTDNREITDDNIDYLKESIKIYSPLEKLMNNNISISIYNNKKLSIFGDSISTYVGYIPEGNANYYTGNNAGVTNVNQTWWKKIIDGMHMELLVNNSWSGRAVSSVRDNVEAHQTDAGYKLANAEVLGNNGTPEVIIIKLGINDFNSGANLGTYDGSTELPTDPSYFTNAYAMMLHNIMTLYPLAKVFCCTLMQCERTGVLGFPETNSKGNTISEYNEYIQKIANAFGATTLHHDVCGITYYNLSTYMGDYSSSTGQGLHPNAQGHSLIANQTIHEMDNYIRKRY